MSFFAISYQKLTVSHSEEDEEETEAGEPANSNAAEDAVKKETASPPPQKSDPYELKTYTEDELDEMEPKKLNFEVAKYEGKSTIDIHYPASF